MGSPPETSTGLYRKTIVELLFVGKSRKTLQSICGRLSIASLLILDGHLSTLFKRSANISKIASSSVKRVLPSALSNVVTPEHFGPEMVFSASCNKPVREKTAGLTQSQKMIRGWKFWI